MRAPSPPTSESADARRITLAGIALLAGLAAVMALGPRAIAPLQGAWFDAYQRMMPRQVVSMPVIVVEIDERSLARYGQWPWPRTRLAELVRDIEQQSPAAIAIDILMPEPDRLSPEHLLRSARQQDPILANRLDALPSNDSVLASAIAAGPVVLGWAGTSEASGFEAPAAPFVVIDAARGANASSGVAARVPRFGGSLSNIPELDRAAAGHGVVSAGSTEQVFRRAPLVVRVEDRLAPSLATEVLRVALGEPDLRLYARGSDVDGVGIGRLTLPTEADGQLRLHYAKRGQRREVSAVDVLEHRVDPATFERKLVLIGVTGLAIVDSAQTPLGEQMPGSEIHAQLLENMYDQAWLVRPRWAPVLELTLFALLGLLLVYTTPRWRPDRASVLAVACVALLLVGGVAAFAWRRTVFDAAVPAVGLLLLFGVLLVLTLVETTRQRRVLERAMQRQREHAAYLAGELEAAKRVQTGLLPRADALAGESRAEVAASMTPAREVGGDLYDYFMRDGDRLFFLVGDVSGKGLSASLFMTMGKALYKSVAMRSAAASAGEIMQAANAELSRDNPEMFFIAAVAGILDLESGVLDYCNAGHESPIVMSPADGQCTQLAGARGPPLCAVDGFNYANGRRQLKPGEVICIVTDGVTEAQDPRGECYGMPRLLALLSGIARSGIRPRALVDAVRADVETFAAAAEPADDLTILALRWNGGRGSTNA